MQIIITGAAVGPLLAGVVSAYGWQNVFYMLMAADVFAMLVSFNTSADAGNLYVCTENTV